MKRVKQKHENDCGIACIAMIAGVSYREALKAAYQDYLSDDWNRKDFRLGQKEIRAALDNFGLKLGRKVRTTDWNKVPDRALAAIRYEPEINEWHWVVHIRDSADRFVLDPRKTIRKERRTDFQVMTLAWYHHVHTLSSS
jgi:ABC-type bacteriocin/lantibiotic exporter with double-glycine peptidase domain